MMNTRISRNENRKNEGRGTDKPEKIIRGKKKRKEKYRQSKRIKNYI